jgi:predicted P-loop ATPase/GTPase
MWKMFKSNNKKEDLKIENTNSFCEEDWDESCIVKTNKELMPLFLELKEKEKIRKQKSLEKLLINLDIAEEFKKYVERYFYDNVCIIRIPYLKYDIQAYINDNNQKIFIYQNHNNDKYTTLELLLMHIIGEKKLEIK